MVLSEKDRPAHRGTSVYMEVDMRTCALIAFILVTVALPTLGDVTTGGLVTDDPIEIVVLHPASSLLWPASSTLPSTLGAVRMIRLTVSPASPGPKDPVSVKIEAEAHSSYLVLDRTTVDKQSGNVTINLYWSDHTPPPSLFGTVQSQASSIGYGIEQIPLTPSAVLPGKTYETTETLGTFAVGAHMIQVYSHGALDGEASALFQVSSPGGIFSDVFGPIGLGDPGVGPESIWTRLGLTK
jgi:hypothetical protein